MTQLCEHGLPLCLHCAAEEEQAAFEFNRLQSRLKEAEANLQDFVDAGAGESIDLDWHRRAFDRACMTLAR